MSDGVDYVGIAAVLTPVCALVASLGVAMLSRQRKAAPPPAADPPSPPLPALPTPAQMDEATKRAGVATDLRIIADSLTGMRRTLDYVATRADDARGSDETQTEILRELRRALAKLQATMDQLL